MGTASKAAWPLVAQQSCGAEGFCDLDHRRLISFSLKTSNFSEAKLKAAQISLGLEQEWAAALVRGECLTSQGMTERYRAATEAQTSCGFSPKPAEAFSDEEMLDRLRELVLRNRPRAVQRSVL